MKIKIRITLLATAAALTILLLVGMARQEAPPTIEVRAATALAQDIFNSVYAPGEIEAVRGCDQAFPRAATVTMRYVEAGDVVHKGQPLVRLRESALEISEETMQTFAENVLAGDAADTVSAAVQDAAAPKEYDVVADMAGTVLRVPSAVGDKVLPGIVYVKIADLSELCVRADIPETYISDVCAGQSANVTSTALPDQISAATVQSVAPYARRAVSFTGETATATVSTRLKLLGQQQNLRPGYSVDVKIFTDKVKDAVLVPYEALRMEASSTYVFIAKDGVAARRYVETGYEMSGYIQLKSGVNAGDIVVLSPPETLADGDLITATNA